MNRLKTFLFTATLVSGASAAHGVTIVWEQEYLPSNGLPSDVNANWNLVNEGGVSSIVTSGSYDGQPTLLIDSRLNTIYWNFTDGWNGNSVTGSTLEFALKVTRDSDTWASQIFWTGGPDGDGHGLRLALSDGDNDDINTTGGNRTGTEEDPSAVDFQTWHNWRIVIDPDGTSSLYMDDNDTAVWVSPSGAGGGSYLQFGDGGSAGVAGQMEIAFIRWTNSEAVAGGPGAGNIIPEPTSLGLMAVAGTMLLRRRRSA